MSLFKCNLRTSELGCKSPFFSFAALGYFVIRVRVSEPTFCTIFMVCLRVREYLGYEVTLKCLQRCESKKHLKRDMHHQPLSTFSIWFNLTTKGF